MFRVRGSVGAVYAAVAARHGLQVAPDVIEARFHAAFHRMPPLGFAGAPETELPALEYAWWREVAAAVFSGVAFADFEAFFRDLFDYFADAGAWELFDDVIPALDALGQRGLRLAIVSNFDARLFPICAGLGIADAFDVIVVSSRVGYAKPDPRIFQHALARMGVRTSDALHVGDSEREDIAGAHAAGLRAIQIDRAHTKPVAPNTIRDLRDLVSLQPLTVR